MVIDPVVVCAPGGDWNAIGLVDKALRADPSTRAALQGTLRKTPVKELRLLHCALVALYPSLCTQPRGRVVALNDLLALCSTDLRYQYFVDNHADKELPRDDHGRVVMATRKEMADAPYGIVFHPQEFSAAYLEMDEEMSWETFWGRMETVLGIQGTTSCPASGCPASRLCGPSPTLFLFAPVPTTAPSAATSCAPPTASPAGLFPTRVPAHTPRPSASSSSKGRKSSECRSSSLPSAFSDSLTAFFMKLPLRL